MPPPSWTPRPRVSAALLEAVEATSVVVLDGLPRAGRTACVRDVRALLPQPVRWVGATAGAAADPEAPRTVVVDDAHRLPLDVLDRLVQRACERDDVRLLLLGRGALPLDRGRLRAEGRLAELPGLLAWRPFEVDALLLAAGVPLGPRAVERLTRGTGGWTGLVVDAVDRLTTEQAPERAVDRVVAGAQALAAELLPADDKAVLDCWPQVVGGGPVPAAVREAGLLSGLLVVRGGRVTVAPEALVPVGAGVPARAVGSWRSQAALALTEQRWVDALVCAAELPPADPARAATGQRVAEGLLSALPPEDAICLLDLPDDLVAAGPWTRLSLARALAVQGDLLGAGELYEALRSRPGLPDAVARRARAEQQALSFLGGGAWRGGPGWLRLLCAALSGDPRAVAAKALTSADPTERLAGQVAQLLADGQGSPGRPPGDLGAALSSVVVLLDAALRALADDPPRPGVLHALGERSARSGHAVLSRAAQAVAELADGTRPPSGWWAASSVARHDAWGECLARLVDGLTWCRVGDRHAGARELLVSASLAEAVGAPVLALWGRLLARTEGRDRSLSPTELLQRAEDLRVPGAVRLLSVRHPAPAPRTEEAVVAAEVAAAVPDATSGVHLLCLGTPALFLDGVPVSRGVLKPRHRALLHLLGARAGEHVHRDELVDALWPDTPHLAGLRSLQVAVSAVRQVLAQADQGTVLQRDAEAYQLVPGTGLRVDVKDFVLSSEQGLQALRRSEVHPARRLLQEALEVYRGDLLIGERPADWLLRQRDHLRVQAVASARGLSELLLFIDDAAAAAAAAERGLLFDPYDDQLWRTLVAAHQAAGNGAGARRAEERYRQVLAELEVENAR